MHYIAKYQQYLWLFVALSITYCTQCTSHYRTNTHSHSPTDIKDKIIELQCYAKCDKGFSSFRKNIDNLTCRDDCRIEVMKSQRHGSCPNMLNVIFRNINPLQKLSCLDNCQYDYDCPDVQKCCESSCGPVCMDAIGVRDDSLLPPTPKILKYKLPRGHKVEITILQSLPSGNALYSYYCHVEVRYHIGLSYSPRKLGMWQWQPVEKIAESSDSKNKRTDISFNLKPGRWYQVRVAAINAYGFRGYSEPSEPFRLPNHPKPPRPSMDLKIFSSYYDGKYYNVKIIWCPSKSNLPIEKYKIIWSLYVKSKDESLISNEAYVKDTHQYEITKLLPESSYYIQVQAMSIRGNRRLKSDKISLLYNTTSVTLPHAPLVCTPQHLQKQHYNTHRSDDIIFATTENNRIRSVESLILPATAASSTTSATGKNTTHYDVRFRLNRKFGMIVQISGFQPHKEKVYELCPKETNCQQREYSAIRAKKDSLEFSKLNYNTTYMLKAFGTNAKSAEDTTASFTFTTPKCENFRKRFPKMQIKC